MTKPIFAIIAGPRLGGKTTTAGTLPGKTIMLQANVLESGSRSAQSLAKRRGNELITDGFVFNDLVDFWPKLEKAMGTDAQHIYIDGFSAINDLRWGQDDIQRCHKNNPFQAYDLHGQDMVKLLRKIKEFSYYDKNIFLTCALRVDQTGNAAPDVKLEAKGKMAVTEITKIGEAVLTVALLPTDQGMQRTLITKSVDNWPGRIDGVLDDENPGVMAPDLGLVLQLLENCA